MNSPAVSIVIRNYNYARFLRDAVDSALAQTYPNVEVIIVDDGSTDDSRSIIASYGKRIVPVLKENGGEGSGVNAGFAISRGDILIYLDSDDVLRPEAVENVVKAFEPGVVRIQYPLTLTNADGRSAGAETPVTPLSRSQLLHYMLRGIVVEKPPTSGNAFTREFLKKILPMPEEEWRRAADAYLWVFASFMGGSGTITRSLGFYRVHSNNLNAATSLDMGRLRATLREAEPPIRLVQRLADERGLKLRENWPLWNPNHVTGRLVSLKLEPEQHPFRGETKLGLALQGIRASVQNPLFTLRKRIFYSAWFVMLLLLPHRAVKRLMDFKLKVTFHGRLRGLLGSRGRAIRATG